MHVLIRLVFLIVAFGSVSAAYADSDEGSGAIVCQDAIHKVVEGGVSATGWRKGVGGDAELFPRIGHANFNPDFSLHPLPAGDWFAAGQDLQAKELLQKWLESMKERDYSIEGPHVSSVGYSTKSRSDAIDKATSFWWSVDEKKDFRKAGYVSVEDPTKTVTGSLTCESGCYNHRPRSQVYFSEGRTYRHSAFMSLHAAAHNVVTTITTTPCAPLPPHGEPPVLGEDDN